MLAMASGGAAIFGGLPRLVGLVRGDSVIAFLAGQLDHVAWRGCCFWDLIQPSFMFLVGVAMPFSYASRRERGESHGRLVGHAIVRSLILILLAVFLSSTDSRRTNFVFVNVLAQIGLGYTFVFLLLGQEAVGAVRARPWRSSPATGFSSRSTRSSRPSPVRSIVR